MKIQLISLTVRTKRSIERIDFSKGVTFLHGPIGKGKSTVARLIDYCLGGDLERTPAIQKEFLAAELSATLGDFECILERTSEDTQSVRVTWSHNENSIQSVSAPLDAGDQPIVGEDIFNLSDLIFFLCDVIPIKVRKRSRDPESPLIRLSIRDIWRYCYLDQTHLDSSFFRLEDPFRGRKSQDAMRFFTGLHSERLNQLEGELFQAIDDQRAKRAAVQQIRAFMAQFGWSTDLDIGAELATARAALDESKHALSALDETRHAETHPTDTLKEKLRSLGSSIDDLRTAITDSEESIAEQHALRAELITAKTKASRAAHAGKILEGVAYHRCPECGSDITDRPHSHDHCRLCGTHTSNEELSSLELEALYRDLNDRIDQIADSIERRNREVDRMKRQLKMLEKEKSEFDDRLQLELARYDSALIESMRASERDIATLTERMRSLERLQKMPEAIDSFEEEAGSLQGKIDLLRSTCNAERDRLKAADDNVGAISSEFKRILSDVAFPGISAVDDIEISPRNWNPVVIHDDQQWGFWDTGSGGKKTLFNVCYALAIHSVALSNNLPVPNILIIDSPTKNISDDENPELIISLYDEIYKLARGINGKKVQFVLIDSDLVTPATPLNEFKDIRMAGEPNAPALISYYTGP